MSALISSAVSANFNEPQSDDSTSAPPLQIPQQPAPGLAQALAQRKKKKRPIGLTVKTPGPLASAISAAKKARQGGHKFG